MASRLRSVEAALKEYRLSLPNGPDDPPSQPISPILWGTVAAHAVSIMLYGYIVRDDVEADHAPIPAYCPIPGPSPDLVHKSYEKRLESAIQMSHVVRRIQGSNGLSSILAEVNAMVSDFLLWAS